DQLIAFLSGHLFMFSSYRLLHGREHLPLLLASFLVPLFALCLFRAAARPGTATYVPCALVWGVSAGVSCRVRCSLSISLAVFLLVATPRGARTGSGVSGPVPLALRQLRSLAVAGLVAVPTASAFVLPMVISPAAHDGILDRSLDESSAYSA